MTEIFAIPNEVREGSLADPVAAATITAVFNSMRIIRRAQQERVLLRDTSYASAIKEEDGSLLTPVDIRSQRTAKAVFGVMLPGVPFEGEEKLGDDLVVSQPAMLQKLAKIGYDPADGTRPLTVGAPTSTVISVAYGHDGSVLGAAIGEPATERMYSAFNDEPTTGRIFDLRTGETLAKATAATWKGDISQKGQAFIDNNIPHAHNGHGTLLADQHLSLRQHLQQDRVGIMEMGSNGAHQLYIASGGERAALAFTTARGIPEDTSAGAFLVERAGGAVQRFHAVGGVISHATFESPDYDLLVVANNPGTLDYANDLLLSISR